MGLGGCLVTEAAFMVSGRSFTGGKGLLTISPASRAAPLDTPAQEGREAATSMPSPDLRPAALGMSHPLGNIRGRLFTPGLGGTGDL